MSTVVGVIKNGEIWMGSDGIATTSEGERRNINCKKIFRNKRYLFGFVGSIRIGQLLQPEYFKAPSNIINLPDAILDYLKEKDCIAYDSETGVSLLQSNFLIASPDNKLYEILSDFQLNEIIDFTAIGSGSYFACGSLHSTKKSKNPERRIIRALEASSSFDSCTGKPFTVVKYK